MLYIKTVLPSIQMPACSQREDKDYITLIILHTQAKCFGSWIIKHVIARPNLIDYLHSSIFLPGK